MGSKPTITPEGELIVLERRFRWLPRPRRRVVYVYTFLGGWRKKMAQS